MKSKEEILKPLEVSTAMGNKVVGRTCALAAMEEYADAYSAGLVIMLAELAGRVEMMRAMQDAYANSDEPISIVEKNNSEAMVDIILDKIRNAIEEEVRNEE